MHHRLTTLPASTTIGELRDYFGESTSRRLALVVDDEARFLGAIVADDVPADGDADSAAPIAGLVRGVTTIAPSAPAADARDLALAEPSRRLPVVDTAGSLVGIVAIDKQRERFCGA